MPLTIETNLPLVLGLLLALATYLVAVSLPLGPERPSLADWLARHERRPPVDPHALAAPEYRSPVLEGLVGPLLIQAAGRVMRLGETVGLGQPSRLARRLRLAGQGSPIDHYAQKLGSAAILAVAGLGVLGLTAPAALAGRLPGPPWWLPAALGLIGFLLPEVTVERALRRRRALLQAGVAQLLDRLTLHLAAGLSLHAGLDSAVRHGGLLAGLLEPVLTGARLGGATLTEGLHRLGAEWGLPELHRLAVVVGLREEQGVTVRTGLTNLAADLRAAERARLARAGHWATLRQTAPVATLLLLAFAAVLVLPAIDSILSLRGR